MFNYQIFGFPVISNMALPELKRVDQLTSALSFVDAVSAMEGIVPTELKNGRKAWGWIEFSERACLFHVPNVGRFLIEAGQKLTVERYEGVSFSDMRAYLFGLAFPALAMQRGLMPLHISAISTPLGVWAFTGNSGAGKSTLVTRLHLETRWALISDDVACVDLNNSTVEILAGINSVRLCKDAIENIDNLDFDFEPYFQKTEKYQANNSHSFGQGGTLVSLVELAWGHYESLVTVNGSKKLEIFSRSIYRPELVQFLLTDRNYKFHKIAALINKFQIYIYQRPPSVFMTGDTIIKTKKSHA